MAAFAGLFFRLMCGHALADYALQSEYMARNKRRLLAEPGAWLPTLGAHALIHAGLVIVVTGSTTLGLLEFVAHFCIDLGKTEGWYGIIEDQAAHTLCKLGWAYLVVVAGWS